MKIQSKDINGINVQKFNSISSARLTIRSQQILRAGPR